ncbi:TetR/AcrR family transcriptional regulator [Streptomyces sp. NPDC005438]|uniref:TetR/AcrR family transcriptional regulator n=1 Tax=Streptomyces sp. NPDC005438 TaxID=3156880 RepID=UPI0033B242F2
MSKGAGGRPRDAAREEALLSAVIELLDEVGYEGLTIDAVARRAQASKATVYRRWPSKEALICAALLNVTSSVVPVPDTGELVEDLRLMLRHSARALKRNRSRIAAIVAAVATRPELTESFDRLFLAGRRAAARGVYERALERGELAPGPDIDLLIDAAPALLLQRVLYQPDEPLDDAFVDRVVNGLILPALGEPRGAGQQRRKTP